MLEWWQVGAGDCLFYGGVFQQELYYSAVFMHGWGMLWQALFITGPSSAHEAYDPALISWTVYILLCPWRSDPFPIRPHILYDSHDAQYIWLSQRPITSLLALGFVIFIFNAALSPTAWQLSATVILCLPVWWETGGLRKEVLSRILSPRLKP